MIDLQHMSSANIPLLYTGSDSHPSSDNTTAGALSLVTADDQSRHHQTTSGSHSKSTQSSSSSSTSEGSSDTLVDAASMVSISVASSCNTYISEGGDAYKCARNEFRFKKRRPKNALDGTLVGDNRRVLKQTPKSALEVWSFPSRYVDFRLFYNFCLVLFQNYYLLFASTFWSKLQTPIQCLHYEGVFSVIIVLYVVHQMLNFFAHKLN